MRAKQVQASQLVQQKAFKASSQHFVAGHSGLIGAAQRSQQSRGVALVAFSCGVADTLRIQLSRSTYCVCSIRCFYEYYYTYRLSFSNSKYVCTYLHSIFFISFYSCNTTLCKLTACNANTRAVYNVKLRVTAKKIRIYVLSTVLLENLISDLVSSTKLSLNERANLNQNRDN